MKACCATPAAVSQDGDGRLMDTTRPLRVRPAYRRLKTDWFWIEGSRGPRSDPFRRISSLKYGPDPVGINAPNLAPSVQDRVILACPEFSLKLDESKSTLNAKTDKKS